MAEQPPIYVNGHFVSQEAPALSALDRGLTLADGVFETMVAVGGRISRLEDHLARLHNSAAVLELPLPPDNHLSGALHETLRRSGLDRAVLRLTVTRGFDPGRGVAVHDGLTPTIVVRAAPLASRETPLQGILLHTCSFPRSERSPLSWAKTLGYTEAVAAWLEARRAGAADALLLNTQGNVAGATTSNVFIVRGDEVSTPASAEGALPGIARRTVMALADSLGLRVTERPVRAEELPDANEVFLTNVVRGPMPVAGADGHLISNGKPGPVTLRLVEAYWQAVETGTRLPSPP